MLAPLDYSKYQTVSAIPEASSMIETFRAIGYNIETAVADIIDNLYVVKTKCTFCKRVFPGFKLVNNF